MTKMLYIICVVQWQITCTLSYVSVDDQLPILINRYLIGCFWASSVLSRDTWPGRFGFQAADPRVDRRPLYQLSQCHPTSECLALYLKNQRKYLLKDVLKFKIITEGSAETILLLQVSHIPLTQWWHFTFQLSRGRSTQTPYTSKSKVLAWKKKILDYNFSTLNSLLKFKNKSSPLNIRKKVLEYLHFMYFKYKYLILVGTKIEHLNKLTHSYVPPLQLSNNLISR